MMKEELGESGSKKRNSFIIGEGRMSEGHQHSKMGESALIRYSTKLKEGRKQTPKNQRRDQRDLIISMNLMKFIDPSSSNLQLEPLFSELGIGSWLRDSLVAFDL